MHSKLSPALKVSFIYLIFSLVWIFTSDSVVANISPNIETLNFLQTIKGWVFVTATSVLIFILTNRYLKQEKLLQQNLLNRTKELESIIQNSPTPMVVLREDGKFLMMNNQWLKLSKYEFEEINTLQKWTQKAYGEKAEMKQEQIQKLFDIHGVDDNGEFILFTKDNKELHWHFYSCLLGVNDGLKTLVATAIDITELDQKNRLIIQQAKMSALGEMIENIAHQWRQPLSNITTVSTGIEVQEEYAHISKELLIDNMKIINENAQYLSNTINDFSNFFDKEKIKRYFKIKSTIERTINLIKPRLITHNVTIETKLVDVEIESFENELIQVLINIFNNAIDSLKNQEDNRLIYVSSESTKEHIIIQICDTGAGLDEEIISRVFEPYFTTKHKSQGTGIGLYMSEEIITKHMYGTIDAFNSSFKVNDEQFSGACFKITLPLR